MKKILLSIGGLLLIAVGAGFLFKEQLWEVAKTAITADMYVSADTDAFDPGLPTGAAFPAIKATYKNQQITSIDEFARDKGMIFIANRSADW